MGLFLPLCCWLAVIAFVTLYRPAEFFELLMDPYTFPWAIPTFLASMVALHRWNFKALIPLLALFLGTVDGILLWQIPETANAEGKIIVVTGANSGIGFSAAKQLGALGATVILACRRPNSCAEAAREIPHAVVGPRFDLGDPLSVPPFAEWVRTKYNRVDILVNNAGFAGMGTEDLPPFPGKQGPVDPSVGYMHLCHFALTRALLPSLRAAKKPMVINLSSVGSEISFVFGVDYKLQHWDPSSPEFPFSNVASKSKGNSYSPWFFPPVAAHILDSILDRLFGGQGPPWSENIFIKYLRAKYANTLFSHEIPKRYGIASKTIVPGYVLSNIGGGDFFDGILNLLLVRASEPGSRGILRAVLDDFPGQCVSQMTNDIPCLERFAFLYPATNLADAAARLWEWSEANV